MNYSHGLSHTRIDNIYKSMLSRCFNTLDSNYKRYGGRGISVCYEWVNDKTLFFKWAFSNGYSESLTIDRIDNNGNYEPNNCRWVSYETQNNNRRNNKIITFNGETHTQREWEKKLGFGHGLISSRLKKGWSIERSLTEKPYRGKNQYKQRGKRL